MGRSTSVAVVVRVDRRWWVAGLWVGLWVDRCVRGGGCGCCLVGVGVAWWIWWVWAWLIFFFFVVGCGGGGDGGCGCDCGCVCGYDGYMLRIYYFIVMFIFFYCVES